jgi:hypothetical protein
MLACEWSQSAIVASELRHRPLMYSRIASASAWISSSWYFTTSPMLTMPRSRPSSSTMGMWRIRRATIAAMIAAHAIVSGAGEDLLSHHGANAVFQHVDAVIRKRIHDPAVRDDAEDTRPVLGGFSPFAEIARCRPHPADHDI